MLTVQVSYVAFWCGQNPNAPNAIACWRACSVVLCHGGLCGVRSWVFVMMNCGVLSIRMVFNCSNLWIRLRKSLSRCIAVAQSHPLSTKLDCFCVRVDGLWL